MEKQETWPCGTPKNKGGKSKRRRNDPAPNANRLMGPPVDVRSIEEVNTPDELIRHCFPSFGAARVRRLYNILDYVIGEGIPISFAGAGPLTVSNQHRAWTNTFIKYGWVSTIAVTDACCYHDGHDALRRNKKRPVRELVPQGHDEQYRKAGLVRIYDAGFHERVLFDQDQMITTMLRRREFQHKMSGTEFRNRIGKYYAALEERHGVKPGLLSTCWRYDVPVFVGAPGDGSAYLNHVKLWALAQRGKIKHAFELDVAREVFEYCAYHYWGLTASENKQLAIMILGGGVPKNFSLQPEPTLSQIFLLDKIRGFDFDVQIVDGKEDNGGLSTCPAAEAHTWGKVSKKALRYGVEGLNADYTTVMPLIAWALEMKRRGFINAREAWREREGVNRDEIFYRAHPQSHGFIRPQGPLRIFRHLPELTETLLDKLTTPAQLKKLMKTMHFPLALLREAA